MSEQELLPCPFCGCASSLIVSEGDGTKYSGPHWKASCPTTIGEFVSSCVGSSLNTWEMTPEDAAAAWNRRPTPPADGGEMGEAVAWQHRLPNSRAEAWEPCSKATYDDILKWPQRWNGWEARPLYATPVAAGGVVVPRSKGPDFALIAFMLDHYANGATANEMMQPGIAEQRDQLEAWLAAAPQQSAQGGWPTVDDAMVERANAADWGCCEWSHQTDNVKAAERIHMREILAAALPLPPGEGAR